MLYVVLMDIQKKTILTYERTGILFIIIVGSLLHFTFEWSGSQPIIGVFSAVNESVWEHLKLGFWPTLMYTAIEYWRIKKETNNFFVAKTAGAYATVLVIPAIFYGYTSITGESVFMIDILSFIIAVIIGQYVSYRLLTYKQLPKNYEFASLVALSLLAAAFIVFTFVPPHLPPFQDPISGNYGIIEHH